MRVKSFSQIHASTLLVNPWLQSKGLLVASPVNCLICNKPETIEHIFLDCHDAVFLWDVLRRTLKKELPPFAIRFLPYAELGEVQSAMLMLLWMQSAWQTRVDVKHAHVPAHTAKRYFAVSVMYYTRDFRAQCEPPQSWTNSLLRCPFKSPILAEW